MALTLSMGNATLAEICDRSLFFLAVISRDDTVSVIQQFETQEVVIKRVTRVFMGHQYSVVGHQYVPQ